jgi:hypothetical protein
MAGADADRRIGRAVVDLAEAVLLRSEEETAYAAVVMEVDERWARIQLRDRPIVARLPASGSMSGETLTARLIAVDAGRRTITFERASADPRDGMQGGTGGNVESCRSATRVRNAPA